MTACRGLTARFARPVVRIVKVGPLWPPAPHDNHGRFKTAKCLTCCHERIAKRCKAFCDRALASWVREPHFGLCMSWYVMVCDGV